MSALLRPVNDFADWLISSSCVNELSLWVRSGCADAEIAHLLFPCGESGMLIFTAVTWLNLVDPELMI